MDSYSHIFNGILIIIAVIIIFVKFSYFKKLDTYKLVILILLISVSIGLFGLTHTGFESRVPHTPMDTAMAVAAETLILV
jgi:hypothetical protein